MGRLADSCGSGGEFDSHLGSWILFTSSRCYDLDPDPDALGEGKNSERESKPERERERTPNLGPEP